MDDGRWGDNNNNNNNKSTSSCRFVMSKVLSPCVNTDVV